MLTTGVIAAALLATGCGAKKSTGTKPATSTVAKQAQPDLASQRAAYLRIVTPFNAKLASAQKQDITHAGTRAKVTRLFRTVDWQLLNADWSPSVRADVKEIVRLDAALISDLRTSDGDAWTRDVEALSAQVNIVRSDLGLPPAK